MTTERTEVARILTALAAEGWHVTSIDNGGDADERPATIDAALDVIFGVDCCTIVVTREGRNHGILIVLGNDPDGSEVVADYGFSDPDSDGFGALMGRITDQS
jgi:hypothetical protein